MKLRKVLMYGGILLLGLLVVLAVLYFQYPLTQRSGGNCLDSVVEARHPFLPFIKKRFGSSCAVPAGWIGSNSPSYASVNVTPSIGTQTRDNSFQPDYTPPLTADTSSWTAYANNSLGFSVQYPSDTKPSLELNDEYNRLTAFGDLPGKYFEVRLQKDDNPDMGVKYGFLGADVIATSIKMGGINGYEAVSTAGYGDAGAQGSPYVEFAARHNGDVYHLIFYGDANTSPEELQILSTFKFTK